MTEFRRRVTSQVVFLTRTKSTGLSVVKEVHSLAVCHLYRSVHYLYLSIYLCINQSPIIYLSFIYYLSVNHLSII